MTIRFALNHMVAPRKPLREFFSLARSLGIRDVEIRNDIPTPVIDGTPAAEVAAEAKATGIALLSINALQRFNEWNDVRAAQAAKMIDYARECGAAALVLCPVNDVAYQLGEAARSTGLREALAALAPILREATLTGLVEPLGFAESSLRSKREAVEAIDAVGGADVFKLVHDTFHHHVAGEVDVFPARTGLVHISGVSEPNVAASAMRDPHRVLVDAADMLGNTGQIHTLLKGGYSGVFSFEPFAESVTDREDVRQELVASMAFIEREANRQAA